MAIETRAIPIRRVKWIDDTSPDQPVEEVAQRVVEARVEVVWQFLPLAAAGPVEDVELVHQLRVSSRRAMAALEIFDPLLPSRRTVWLTKQLKRVRQAAGTARDLDVLIKRLRDQLAGVGDASCAALLQSAERLRQQAQQPIREIQEKLQRKDFPQRLAAVVKRIRLRGTAGRVQKPTFGQTARRELRTLVDDFFAAAANDLTDYDALHGFRIEGKRLRYAMEVFAGAFEPGFRKTLYPLVESLQEKLGEVNDHCAALAMFAAWPDKTDDPALAAALAALTKCEQSVLETSRGQFLEWWTAERCQDLAARFATLLAGDNGHDA